jgi:hypothetical protein
LRDGRAEPGAKIIEVRHARNGHLRVSFDLVGKQPIVLLKTADGNKFLPIWIGHPRRPRS